MRHIAPSAGVVLTLFFAAGPAQASPIHVQVLSKQFTVTVTVSLRGSLADTKTSTSSDPVSESLSGMWCDDNFQIVDCGSPAPLFLTGLADADAAADLLGVSAIGSALYAGDAIATAETEWTFSPVVDGVAYIDIFGTHSFICCGQSASLFDLTVNEPVWQFSSTFWQLGLSQTVPTLLSTEHVYQMRLAASAYGSGDYTWSNLHVSGIQAVPDNVDSFVCLCMGLLVALLGKWKLGT